MIDDTKTKLTDEAVHPLLIDLVRDRELNQLIQKHSSSDEGKIEIKVFHNEKELFRVTGSPRNFVTCPCGEHPGGNCSHIVVNNKAICSG